MRRILLAFALLLGATAAFAANPFFLDRNGVLWTATSDSNGLALTGTRDGQTIVQTVVPFQIGLAGSNDTQIQVAADDLTGKVAVVWQRNWSDTVSEIMLAVWGDGSWQRIEHLTSDPATHPRNPAIQVTQVSTYVPDPTAPSDPTKATLVQDSFLHVIWWEGSTAQNGGYALLRLTADPDDTGSLVTMNLDTFADVGLACNTPAGPDVLEHPLLASQSAHDRALIFFGSERNCFFELVQVSFGLDPGTGNSGGGMTATTQRRRHMPIFGVMKQFPMTPEVGMESARIVLGSDLRPVVYRVVNGNALEYITATDTGWSPRRTLTVANGLTLDQAIPLVENLAR